jgi:predicted Zn finger-like uncharacterized protein
MSIPIRCPECKASYRVSDETAGKTIRCKECDARVAVPEDGRDAQAAVTAAEAEPRPSRRRSREDDDADEPRQSRKRAGKGGSNTMTILLVIGGILGVSCFLCIGIGGIAGYWVYGKAAKIADDIKQELNAGLVPPGVGKIILSKQDVLRPNDPHREGHPHKPFTINFQQGKTYVIDLQSTEMDSYLLLYDPANMKVGEDDDGGGFPNARIRFTAMQTGVHTIACSVFGGVQPQGARFNLTVREE